MTDLKRGFPIQGGSSENVEDSNNPENTKKPSVVGGTRSIQSGVGGMLDIIIAALSRVLELHVGRTLPITNDESTKEIKYCIARFDLGTVTQKFVHGTILSNLVLQNIDEFFVTFHAIYRCEQRIMANKDLGTGGSTVNSRSIRVESIGGDSFGSTGNIEGKES